MGNDKNASLKSQLEEIAELQERYSPATHAMFSRFVRIYRELQAMGIDPEWLARTWKLSSIPDARKGGDQV